MPGSTKELTNSADFPRRTTINGQEVVPAILADGTPVAIPTALLVQDGGVSAGHIADVGNPHGVTKDQIGLGHLDPDPLDLASNSAAGDLNLNSLRDPYTYASASFTTTAPLTNGPADAPANGPRVRITNEPVGSHVYQTYEVLTGDSAGVSWSRTYVGTTWSDWVRKAPSLLIKLVAGDPQANRDASIYTVPHTHVQITNATMLNMPPEPGGANATDFTGQIDVDRSGGAIRQTVEDDEGKVYTRKTFNGGTAFTDWVRVEAGVGGGSPTSHLSTAFHTAYSLALANTPTDGLKESVISSAGMYLHPSLFTLGAKSQLVIPGSFDLTIGTTGAGTAPTVTADSIVFDGNVSYSINSAAPVVDGTFKKVDIYIDFVTTATLSGTQYAILLSDDAADMTSIQLGPVGNGHNRMTFRLPGNTVEGPHPDFVYTNNTQRIQLAMSIDYEKGKATLTEGGGWSREVDCTPVPAGVIEIKRVQIGFGVAMELKELIVIGRND